MPTPFEAIMSAGHAVMQAQCPAVVVGNGHTVTGVVSPINTSKMIEAQGMLDEASGYVVLTAANAATVGVADGAKLTIDGEPVRVVAIHRSASDPTVDVYFKHSR